MNKRSNRTALFLIKRLCKCGIEHIPSGFRLTPCRKKTSFYFRVHSLLSVFCYNWFTVNFFYTCESSVAQQKSCENLWILKSTKDIITVVLCGFSTFYEKSLDCAKIQPFRIEDISKDKGLAKKIVTEEVKPIFPEKSFFNLVKLQNYQNFFWRNST